MRILLKGYYGFGNLGDDILLIVAYRILKAKYPDAQVWVFSNFTENLKDFNQVRNYNKYILNLTSPNLEIIDWTYNGEFDLIFHGGGGTYFDHENGGVLYRILNPWLIKFLGVRGLYLLEKWLRKLTGKAFQIQFKRRVGAGIGVGTFASGCHTFLRKMAELGSYDFLWIRDEFSISKLKEYRFKGTLARFTDLAFLSDYWKSPAVIKERTDVKIIGIILMGLPDSQQLLYDQIRSFSVEIKKRGYNVVYFSFDENYDIDFINAFSKEGVTVWRPNAMGMDSYIHTLSACDIVISARAHGAILGSILGAIPICLASSVKLEEVSRMFPNSGFIFNMNVKANELVDTVEKIAQDYKKYHQGLQDDVNGNKSDAQLGLQILQKFL